MNSRENLNSQKNEKGLSRFALATGQALSEMDLRNDRNNQQGERMMKTTKQAPAEEVNHAERNAQAWMDSIVGMMAAMEKAEDERDEATFEGEIFDADGWRERIQESPLEISVRAGWHSPGEKAEDEEFLILLSTGGPALRIVGDLDRYNQPENPRLQYQDWGTPWTDFSTDGDEDEALEKFCAQFYFGE